jgi:acetyltransferase-like isoleucine patch superfamily enzyme
VPEQTLTLQQALAMAVERRWAGDLAEAESILRQILAHVPQEPAALQELCAVLEAQRDAAAPAPPATPAPAPQATFSVQRLRDALVTAGNEALTGLGRRGEPLTFHDFVQIPRIWKYRMLSDCERVSGAPITSQPVLLKGAGEIRFGSGVQFGWHAGPGHYSGYAYLEARSPESVIDIGDRVTFNNGAMLCSEGPGIRIGADAVFGPSVEIVDSDFHDLHPARRHAGTAAKALVEIGSNVFVGGNVKILKGVTIGPDTVVGNGSIVAKDLPAGVIAAGAPARVLRSL